jgi:hypothetical protein
MRTCSAIYPAAPEISAGKKKLEERTTSLLFPRPASKPILQPTLNQSSTVPVVDSFSGRNIQWLSLREVVLVADVVEELVDVVDSLLEAVAVVPAEEHQEAVVCTNPSFFIEAPGQTLSAIAFAPLTIETRSAVVWWGLKLFHDRF